MQHPRNILAFNRAQRQQRHPLLAVNDRVLDWVTDHVLASIFMFDIALVVPLIALLPHMNKLQIVVVVVFSGWVQSWALFALQRSSNKTQRRQEAKAEVDHRALTYLAKLQDEQMMILRRLDQGG